MDEFLAAVERHGWTIVVFGFLAYWAVVGIIKAVRGDKEEE